MTQPASMWLHRRELDLLAWADKVPMPGNTSLLVKESTLIYDAASGELAIVVLNLDDDVSDLMAALKSVRYLDTMRPNGLVSHARVFGHQPRALPRRDFCTTAGLAAEDAHAHAVVSAYAEKVASYYLRYNPELAGAHAEQTAQVLGEWRLSGSLFTSGIINRNNALRYHYDSGNFKNVWSNMIVLRDGAKGGYLSVPDYDVAFALPHNSLIMFDGQSLLHGVTPIVLEREEDVRFSVVFYSLKQMWKCLPLTEEVARARKRRVDRERRRLEASLPPAEEN